MDGWMQKWMDASMDGWVNGWVVVGGGRWSWVVVLEKYDTINLKITIYKKEIEFEIALD